MMPRISRLGFLVLAAAAFAAAPVAVRAHPSVDVVASNWKFRPATIELRAGEATDLRFTSSEGVHGVESAELGIPKTTIMPGQTTKVTVAPKKAGTYVLHCAVICGAGHADMKLTVVVK